MGAEKVLAWLLREFWRRTVTGQVSPLPAYLPIPLVAPSALCWNFLTCHKWWHGLGSQFLALPSHLVLNSFLQRLSPAPIWTPFKSTPVTFPWVLGYQTGTLQLAYPGRNSIPSIYVIPLSIHLIPHIHVILVNIVPSISWFRVKPRHLPLLLF